MLVKYKPHWSHGCSPWVSEIPQRWWVDRITRRGRGSISPTLCSFGALVVFIVRLERVYSCWVDIYAYCCEAYNGMYVCMYIFPVALIAWYLVAAVYSRDSISPKRVSENTSICQFWVLKSSILRSRLCLSQSGFISVWSYQILDKLLLSRILLYVLLSCKDFSSL